MQDGPIVLGLKCNSRKLRVTETLSFKMAFQPVVEYLEEWKFLYKGEEVARPFKLEPEFQIHKKNKHIPYSISFHIAGCFVVTL